MYPFLCPQSSLYFQLYVFHSVVINFVFLSLTLW